jgi:hypothetical protein
MYSAPSRGSAITQRQPVIPELEDSATVRLALAACARDPD